MNNKISQDDIGRIIIRKREPNMKHLINEVVDIHGKFYRLYFEIKKSSLPNYYDLRFFSTYSGASNPDAEQTKWKTTLPKESIQKIINSVLEL